MWRILIQMITSKRAFWAGNLCLPKGRRHHQANGIPFSLLHRPSCLFPLGAMAALGMGLLLSGCQTVLKESGWNRYTYNELHMATVFRIVLYAPSQTVADEAAVAAFERIADLDRKMNDYNPESELSRFSRQPAGSFTPLSNDLFDILRKGQIVSKKSDGAFDVTIGPLVHLWRQARKIKTLPSPEDIAKASSLVGYQKLELDSRKQQGSLSVSGMKLDLGGIAKGYAADEALAVLKKKGIRRAMVAASGDIALGDPPPGKKGWIIEVESLDYQPGGKRRQLPLRNKAISTSGDTEQFIEIDGIRYSHIVNPCTGLGLTERIGVTVIADRATWSDALATAASVLGKEKGLDFINRWPNASARIVYLEGNHQKTVASRRWDNSVSREGKEIE